jgi:hypothetical protein
VRKLFSLMMLLGLGAFGLSIYIAQSEGEGDMCVARANLLAAQVSPALDTLSEKYPLRVGFLRSLFNQNGWLDGVLAEVVAEQISIEDVDEEKSQAECAWEYAKIYVRRADIQDEIVLAIEQEFGLE